MQRHITPTKFRTLDSHTNAVWKFSAKTHSPWVAPNCSRLNVNIVQPRQLGIFGQNVSSGTPHKQHGKTWSSTPPWVGRLHCDATVEFPLRLQDIFEWKPGVLFSFIYLTATTEFVDFDKFLVTDHNVPLLLPWLCLFIYLTVCSLKMEKLPGFAISLYIKFSESKYN